MRSLGSLLLLCFATSTYAKDLPTFDTTNHCRSAGYSESTQLSQCVDREYKSRELLSKLIDRIPTADVDDCIEYSKIKELGSYRAVATCILLYPNFIKKPLTDSAAGERKIGNASEVERDFVDRLKRGPSESPSTSKPLEREVLENPPDDTIISTINADSHVTNPSGDAKRLARTEFHFEHNFGIGATGRDVRELQVFLNANGFPVADSGPGSPGNEVDVFGTNTRNAVIKFQTAHGLTATGFFGSATRKYIARLVGGKPLSPSAPAIRPSDP